MKVEDFLKRAKQNELTVAQSVTKWDIMSPGEEKPKSANGKVSCYFDDATIDELQREANRRRCSISYVVQTAWRLSKETIKKYPSAQ